MTAERWNLSERRYVFSNRMNKYLRGGVLKIEDCVLGVFAMGQSTYTGRPDQISDLKDKSTEQLSRAAEGAERVVYRAAGQAREAGGRMQEVAGNFKGALDKSVRDQPMATIAAAALAGFVLGALWKS